jgi:hypothetical protein
MAERFTPHYRQSQRPPFNREPFARETGSMLCLFLRFLRLFAAILTSFAFDMSPTA